MVSEIMFRKKNLREQLRELSDELLNRIWFVYLYYINSEYILCKDSIFKGLCKKIVRSSDAQGSIRDNQTNNKQ